MKRQKKCPLFMLYYLEIITSTSGYFGGKVLPPASVWLTDFSDR